MVCTGRLTTTHKPMEEKGSGGWRREGSGAMEERGSGGMEERREWWDGGEGE